jgi:hypothetical protein
MTKLRREHEILEGELRTLRDTYNVRQDSWIREKLENQEKMKEYEERIQRLSSSSWEIERVKMVEKASLVDQLKREEEVLRSQYDRLKQENDLNKERLEDYERVARVQSRNAASGDLSRMEQEIRTLKKQ